MKLLLDIPFARSTAGFLRSCGHDVIHVIDRLSASSSDRAIVELASTESRVILCFDLDFGMLVATARAAAPSVLTFRTTRRGAQFVEKTLAEILPRVENDLERGALVTIDDHSVRIRPLPISE